jgi:hypothetical protein
MAEQEKEWWQQGYGYRVQAGTVIGGKKCSYSVITDEATGFTYYQDGDKSDIALKNSTEVCGLNSQEGEPAKVIQAKNGDIVLEAPNGQITLKAKSIRIMGEAGDGEVTIQAGKIVEMDAPASRVRGTNIDIAATSSTSLLGNYVESAAGVQQSSASLVDIFQGSFIGQLLNSLGNLKKFLKIIGG